MNKLHFEFTLEETNVIIKALGHMPFMQVYELIGKINMQANEQLGNGQNLLHNQNPDKK